MYRMKQKRAKKRRVARVDGMVNINLRKVSVELRATLKKIASEHGITMEAMCIEELQNLAFTANPVRAAGEERRGGKVELDGNRGVDGAGAADFEAVTGTGRGGGQGSAGGDSAGGVESGNPGGGEGRTGKLGSRGIVAGTDGAGGEGDSESGQAGAEAVAPIRLKARSDGISSATAADWPLRERQGIVDPAPPQVDPVVFEYLDATRKALDGATGADPARFAETVKADVRAQSVAAHSHVLSSADPTPRMVDTAEDAAKIALTMKKPPAARAKKRLCVFCEKPLERWSATTLRCTGCGRNEAL